ncbi:MAG: hypothetical protein RJA20_2640 [Bacteroidota bacterium]|jgi:hypothetical protein
MTTLGVSVKKPVTLRAGKSRQISSHNIVY